MTHRELFLSTVLSANQNLRHRAGDCFTLKLPYKGPKQIELNLFTQTVKKNASEGNAHRFPR